MAEASTAVDASGTASRSRRPLAGQFLELLAEALAQAVVGGVGCEIDQLREVLAHVRRVAGGGQQLDLLFVQLDEEGIELGLASRVVLTARDVRRFVWLQKRTAAGQDQRNEESRLQ